MYDSAFFETQAESSLRSARVVLDRLFPLIRPRRVLDVGCGVGPWMRAALDLGATEVIGIDGDYVDRRLLLVDPSHFVAADLATQRLADVLGSHGTRPFDLVICLEVAEHLPLDRAFSLVRDLTGQSDIVLFSAAVPFQFGTHHVNEQWPEFWCILFRGQGYSCFDCLRSALWAEPDVAWWYAQNILVFARDSSEAAQCLPQYARADAHGLSFVHPENLLANLLGLPRRHRLLAAAEEVQDFRSLVAANLRGEPALPPLSGPARAASAASDARDVFPWTRMETYEPEAEIAALSHSLAETGGYLQTANDSVRGEQALRKKLEKKLAELEAELDRYVGLEERLRHAVTARMTAETALADDRAQEKARHDALEQKEAQLAAEHQHFLADMNRMRDQLADTAQQLREAEIDMQRRLDELNLRAVHVEAIRRTVPWRATRRALRALRLLPPSAAVVPRPPPPSLEIPPVDPVFVEEQRPVEVPEAKFIKRFGEVLGEVRWWNIAAATARLRRFELFDAKDYLTRNPDVAAAGMDPYEHFIQSGALEGRGRVDPEDLARLLASMVLFDNAVRALPTSAPTTNISDAEFAALVADVGPIGIFSSTQGNVFMNDLAEDLAIDLQSAGVDVKVLDETTLIAQRPPVSIYIAPHEFFTLGRGPEWIRDDVLSEGFLLGTEQFHTTWFQLSLPFILMARGMLDICAQSAELFSRLDMAALHVLPGARLRPQAVTARVRQHPLFTVLPEAAQQDIDPSTPFRDRPIDISFFGTSSPRRDQFFARNAAFFAEYETFNYCRRPGRGPLTQETQDGALTRLAGHVSGHSKISLNIHQGEFGYFEWHRMVRIGMCSGSLVVSDPCLPHPDFIAGEHYLQESPRHLPDLLEWLLRTEEGAREAERVRANVNRLITETYDTRRAVARMLRFFLLHSSRGEANA